MTDKAQPGSIGWIDLTVTGAAELREFYCRVAGWNSAEVDMGEYADYNMLGSDGQPVAGICHARGSNAELPPCWLMYIVVGDLGHSIEACISGGGELVAGPKNMGDSRYCVIRDPAGAVCALYQP